VVVFEPEAGGMPERAGPYVDGTRAAKRILRALGPESLFEPDTFKAYFRAVFQAGVVDTKGIQAYRKSFDFREVARRFRLIEEDEEQAVVPYRRGEQRIGELLERARLNRDNPRKLIRALQRYSVGIGKSALSGYQARGLIVPVRPGLWRWNGGYSELAGIGSGAEAQTWVI
jgi:CRISPR-associated endonuclease/helicase Cas3